MTMLFSVTFFAYW